jgi:hypothetical protein
MKAIAKHDCNVTLYVDLNSISLNQMRIKKGQVIELPVHEDKKIQSPKIAELLGERTVIFIDKMWFIPTYSNDFKYVEE